jgi:homoserine kinase
MPASSAAAAAAAGAAAGSHCCGAAVNAEDSLASSFEDLQGWQHPDNNQCMLYQFQLANMKHQYTADSVEALSATAAQAREGGGFCMLWLLCNAGQTEVAAVAAAQHAAVVSQLIARVGHLSR